MHNLYEHDVDMILQSMHFLWISEATMTYPNIKNHWIKRLACTVLLDSFDTWPIMRVKNHWLLSRRRFFITWEGNYWSPAKQPVSSQNYRSSRCLLHHSFLLLSSNYSLAPLYGVMPRSSKTPGTWKWSGLQWQDILQLLQNEKQ